MAEYTAMNSSNILGEVLKFATPSIPDSCEMCTRIYGNIPSPPLLLKNVGYDGLVKNTYLCKYCWCSCLDSVKFIHYSKDVKAFIRTLANPEWDEKKKKSFVSREWLSITRGEILFQKHRLKKTQAKADFYEKEIYRCLRNGFTKEKARYKELEEGKTKRELREKMNSCKENARHCNREIKLRKITKWFSDRKIPYKLYTHLVYELSRCSLYIPTWKHLGDVYTVDALLSNQTADTYAENGNLIKSKQCRLPPLPEWFNEL